MCKFASQPTFHKLVAASLEDFPKAGGRFSHAAIRYTKVEALKTPESRAGCQSYWRRNELLLKDMSDRPTPIVAAQAQANFQTLQLADVEFQSWKRNEKDMNDVAYGANRRSATDIL